MKTYRIKHNINYTDELQKAKQVALWAVNNKNKTSSKHVKHIGLKSAIANQILKKYGTNPDAKAVSKIKLTIPGANGNIQVKNGLIYVPCLNKTKITPWFDLDQIAKICQIEVDNNWYYVTVEEKEPPVPYLTDEYLGIDVNTSGHFAVISSGPKIIKRGKALAHIKNSKHQIRKKLQKALKYRTLKQIKNKEAKKTKDLLHKISKEVVELAKTQNKGIKFEDLKGIRDSSNSNYKGKKFRRATNNWNYATFRFMVEYKARICGVPLEFVDSAYTSQKCSRCGHTEKANRKNKKFKCLSCGHADHADANASFNIAFAPRLVIAPKAKKGRFRKGASSPEAATTDESSRPEIIQLQDRAQATRSLAAW